MSNLFKEKFVELLNLRGKFALSTKFDSWFTYCVLVNKNQFRLNLYFELFDLEYFRFGSQKSHLAVKSNFGSLLWFHLSLTCQRSFVGQYTAKLFYAKTAKEPK